MKNLEPQQLQEAVFVFLHGPEAYRQGAWEPVLLDVLHEVGFTEVKQVRFKKNLNLTRHTPGPQGVIGGGHSDNWIVPFGVMALEECERGLIMNEAAVHWLDQISSRIMLCRSARAGSRQVSQEEALENFRKTAALLNAGGTIDPPKQAELFVSDPKTVSEYEAMRQNPSAGFDAFEAFFPHACMKLGELIEESRPLEPIVISEFGERFLQPLPPGLHGKHLRDEMPLQEGVHETCGGTIRFIPVSQHGIAMTCDKCHMHEVLPRLKASSFLWLRYRGELFENREELLQNSL